VPFYLKKAGMTAEILEDYNKALTIYKRLQKDFPDSKEGSDVKKYIARVEARL
jgi:hypothetical protein